MTKKNMQSRIRSLERKLEEATGYVQAASNANARLVAENAKLRAMVLHLQGVDLSTLPRTS